jgi:outer membrane protein OmpA-like peptidoglycan-associated protein
MNKTGLSCCLSGLLLAGCVSERVVLLPSADGHRIAVVVRDRDSELLLDRPYASITSVGGTRQSYQSSPEDVQSRFGAALAAQPMRPNSYVLYFEPGGDILTAESQAELVKLRQEVVKRVAAEIMVIGHTDRVGSQQLNDELSKKRAETVRDLLIESGVAAEKLETIGRGERDPLVATEDEVDEPRNRRVEINLR